MKAYETKGQIVHFAPGQKVTLQLQVISDSAKQVARKHGGLLKYGPVVLVILGMTLALGLSAGQAWAAPQAANTRPAIIPGYRIAGTVVSKVDGRPLTRARIYGAGHEGFQEISVRGYF